ncbi:MAG: FHA domain-containing protein [Armatimonadota bacterium]
MSQDSFWNKWGGEPEAEEKKPEGAAPAQAAAESSGIDSDVLAQWLQDLPADDPLVSPPAPGAPAKSPSEPAQWPPAEPVDPFQGLQSGSPASSSELDWDLSLDAEPVPAAAPSSSLAPPPPGPPAGAGDFDFGDMAPAPAAAAPAPPAPPVQSPFGPPPPPPAPPAEALQAPPLRVEVRTGRRTFELSIHGEALIGRPDARRGLNPEIDLRTDDAVSRRHAKIFVRDGKYVLTDLNSTNGTRLNREWLPPEAEAQLKAGDEIEVGELTLIRVLEAPEVHA